MSEIRYVNPAIITTANGWLSTCPGEVDACRESDRVALPPGLKVDLGSERDGRFHFRILEGPLQGKTGSVRKTFDTTLTTLVKDVLHQKELLVFAEFAKRPDASGALPGKLWMGETEKAVSVPENLATLVPENLAT